ncbi:MAG TPA: hypothetical protein VGG27_06705 [Magnetospirillaceae bacterium]|jgi:hypothetical protein
MDWLEFIANSEWPIVAGAALVIERRPIARMIDRVNPTKLGAWGLNAEFERVMDKVEVLTQPPIKLEQTPAIASAGETRVPTSPTVPENVNREIDGAPDPEQLRVTFPSQEAALARKYRSLVGTTQPELQILQAWSNLETIAGQALQEINRRAHSRPVPLGPMSITQTISLLGLTEDETAAIMELRHLRNQVAHAIAAPVTVDDAARYAQAVGNLIIRIMELVPPPSIRPDRARRNPVKDHDRDSAGDQDETP